MQHFSVLFLFLRFQNDRSVNSSVFHFNTSTAHLLLICAVTHWCTIWRSWVRASQTYFQVQPTRCNVTQFIYFLWNALHVSGDSSVHHQELKTVYTRSGNLSNLYCYLPLSWQVAITVWQMLYIQFWAPDDGRRNRLKHVEHFTKNK